MRAWNISTEEKSYLLYSLFKVLLTFVTLHHEQAMYRHKATFFLIGLWNLTENKKEEKCKWSLSNTAMIRNCVALKCDQALTSAGYTLNHQLHGSVYTFIYHAEKRTSGGLKLILFILFFTHRSLLSFYRLLLVTKPFWKDNRNPNTQSYPIPMFEKKVPKVMCSDTIKVYKAKALQNKYFIQKRYICNTHLVLAPSLSCKVVCF